jgi:hypothetical protein
VVIGHVMTEVMIGWRQHGVTEVSSCVACDVVAGAALLDSEQAERQAVSTCAGTEHAGCCNPRSKNVCRLCVT